MKALVVQHIECEGGGYLEDFLYEQQIDFKIARMYEQCKLPNVNDYDVLIVLGGPMNVHEEERYPYFEDLTMAIKNFVAQNRHYLGLCLGAQFLAKALGAEVTQNHVREIGNFEISLTEEGLNSPLFKGFRERFPALEWHQDTFAIAEGATKLAESKLCSNQAFRFRNAYGVQFHLEATPEMIEDWLNFYGDDLSEEGIDPVIIMGETNKMADIYSSLSKQLFVNFFELVKNSSEFCTRSGG